MAVGDTERCAFINGVVWAGARWPLLTAMMAFVGSSVGLQPEMDTIFTDKNEQGGCRVPCFVTGKNPVLLNTTPVGVPVLRAAALPRGMVTTSDSCRAILMVEC